MNEKIIMLSMLLMLSLSTASMQMNTTIITTEDVDSQHNIHSLGNVSLEINGVNWTQYNPNYINQKEDEWSKDEGTSRDSVQLLINRMLEQCNEKRFNGNTIEDKRTREMCQQLEAFIGQLYVHYMYPELHEEIVGVNNTTQHELNDLKEQIKELETELEEEKETRSIQAQNNWDLTRRLTRVNTEDISELERNVNQEQTIQNNKIKSIQTDVNENKGLIKYIEKLVKLNENNAVEQWLVIGILCFMVLLEIGYILIIKHLTSPRE